MSRWSVATTTSLAPLSRARSATWATIGLPPMSARIFPGSRVDACRAGMTTQKFIGQRSRRKENQRLERAEVCASRLALNAFPDSNFFFRRQLARVVLEHHRNAVPDLVRQAVWLAYQFLFRLKVNERTFADRTN